MQRQRTSTYPEGNTQPEAADARSLCNSCADNDRASIRELPDEFWLNEAIQRAISARDFGQLLRAYREAHSPALTQTMVGEVIGLTQGQVSRIERGITCVRDLGKLDQWVRTLAMPEKYAWFNYQSAALAASHPDTLEQESGIPDDGATGGEDVQRRRLLKTAQLGAVILGTSILDRSDTRPQSLQLDEGQPLSIEFMRDATASFRRLDNRYGGGHSRAMVSMYLSTDVEPKLRSGHYSNAIRRDLFTAVAELHQLAGWMAYDMGDVPDGRSHLREALSLCQDVRNDALAAELMAAMSHHAAFHRSADAAVDLALAATQAASRTGLAALRAEAAVLQANGLALQGDARGCIGALQRAEKEFMAVKVADSPIWLHYFDEAYLSAKFAHTLRDLKRPADAERFARRSLEMSEGYERGRLFNTALLASILADQGKVEEAAGHATLAVQMSGSMRSTRTVKYLQDSGQRLLPYKSSPPVQALYRQMKASGVPIQRSL